MGLSSNIIWHQTNFDGLKSILTHKKFMCSYSLEDIHWKSSNLKRAFPMNIFCNIPITDLYEYLKNNKEGKFTGKYGKYTIGLKYNWGSKCGLAPVWYLNKGALCLHEIMQYHKNLEKHPWGSFEHLIWDVVSHVKNYDGSLSKYNFKSYRFYDEKEVRYVPQLSQLIDDKIAPILTHREYDNYKQHNKTALINELHLPFEFSDIAYILISSLSQRNKVLKLIDFNPNIIILSYEQVIKDIIGISHSIKN